MYCPQLRGRPDFVSLQCQRGLTLGVQCALAEPGGICSVVSEWTHAYRFTILPDSYPWGTKSKDKEEEEEILPIKRALTVTMLSYRDL